MKFLILALAVAAASAQEGCEIDQEVMDIGYNCWESCYGEDMYTEMRQEMGLVDLAEAYTCPMGCVMEGLGLFNEDGYPSIPRINELFEGTALEDGAANQCFCEGLNADPMDVLTDISMMGEAGEEMQMERSSVIYSADKKFHVRQCLGLCSADS